MGSIIFWLIIFVVGGIIISVIVSEKGTDAKDAAAIGVMAGSSIFISILQIILPIIFLMWLVSKCS